MPLTTTYYLLVLASSHLLLLAPYYFLLSSSLYLVLATRYILLDTWYLLLVICYMLLATSYLLILANCYLLILASCYSLLLLLGKWCPLSTLQRNSSIPNKAVKHRASSPDSYTELGTANSQLVWLFFLTLSVSRENQEMNLLLNSLNLSVLGVR